MAGRRYIILELADAKALAAVVPPHADGVIGRVRDRIAAETGADVEDICQQLKTMPLCHACVVEGQQGFCNSIPTKALGRRLYRLVRRALADTYCPP